MSDENAGTAKLIQYLTEAHGKETELVQSLEAHIEIAFRPVYKKRLKDHLKETKSHAKQVERRVKKLGGDVGSSTLSKAASVVSGATKAPATAVKGAGHAIRGTGDEEKQLKNAKTEYFNEHEEIANYTAIETLATALGDKETAQLAKGIRREEERMASFLEKQIPLLTKEVVRADVPKSDRAGASTSRRRSSSRSAASTTKRSSASSNGRKAASTTKRSPRKSTAKKSTAKKSSTRKTAAKR